MSIDIERMTENELLDLNHKIVARLKHMRAIRSQVQMLDFQVGERVCFQGNNYETVYGVITKYNRKTVTVVTDDDHRWTVAPSYLRKVVVVVPQTQAALSMQTEKAS